MEKNFVGNFHESPSVFSKFIMSVQNTDNDDKKMRLCVFN